MYRNPKLAKSADDILQYQMTKAPGEALTRALESRERLRPDTDLGAWARAVMYNLSIDDIRPWLRAEDLALIARLAASGAMTPVIDRTFALEDLVEAHRYVELGHKRGNVIVSVGGGERVP